MARVFEKKLGLALGGGGARGFSHVGILQVLEENGIIPDFVAGCSIGAVVGGCYCAGIPLNDMMPFVSKTTQLRVMDFDIMFRKQGVLRGDRAMEMIKELIGNMLIEECKIPFAAVAVDALKAELVTYTSGILSDVIRASMAIPGVFQSAKVGDRECLIDGGMMERVPIKAVKDLGAEVVIAIDVMGPPDPMSEVKGMIEMIERAFSIIDWQSTKDKLAEADLLITPYQPGRQLFRFKNNEESVTMGRVAAHAALPEIKKLLKI